MQPFNNMGAQREFARIPDEVESQIKEKALKDWYSIYTEQVDISSVKEVGKNWFARCPFHEDKTASFTFKSTGEYYCHGCGTGGASPISFLMEIGKRPREQYRDLLIELAGRFGIPIPSDPRFAERRAGWAKQDRLRSAVAAAVAFYHKQLLLSADGEVARSYLKNKRGIHRPVAVKYQLGYASQSGGLVAHLKTQGFAIDEMIEAGVVVRTKAGQIRDFLFNRVVIPIHDEQGRPIALSGRTLIDDERKYLNTGATEIFDKGQTFYALHFARAILKGKTQSLLITEGYFDAIACIEAGIPAVCLMGTALKPESLLRLTRRHSTILGADGDAAGLNALRRVINDERVRTSLLTGQLPLRVMSMPEGSKDPDEVIQSGGLDLLKSAIQSAPGYLDWLIGDWATQSNACDLDGRAKIRKEALKILSQIPTPSDRVERVRQFSEALAPGDIEMQRAIVAESRQQRQATPMKPKESGAILALRPGEAAELMIARCLLWREGDNWELVDAAGEALAEWEPYWPDLWDWIWEDDAVRAVDLELSDQVNLPDLIRKSLVCPNAFDRLALASPMRAVRESHEMLMRVQCQRQELAAIEDQFARAAQERNHA